jgi:peroxin-5
MSFLGGAECSTAGNPLSQFTKHVQDDKSLQRDRLVGRGPGGMQEGMRSQQMGGGSDGVSKGTPSVDHAPIGSVGRPHPGRG